MKQDLHSLEQILGNSVALDFPVIRGIYFLLNQGQVVYVGQSAHCHNRIRNHLLQKEFDRYTIFAVGPEEDLNTLEALYILKYQPRYNLTLPPTPLLLASSWFRNNRVPRYRLRRLVAEGTLRVLIFQNTTYYWRTEIEAAIARGLL